MVKIMKQMVSRNKTIIYILGIVCALVLLMIWPLKLIRYNVTAKSDEIIARESDPISVEYNLTQMFDGIGGRLESVDIYVCNDMSAQTMTFRLYDQEHQQIYEQFYNVDPDFIAPGFVHIPVRYDLIDKNEYSFIVEGLTSELYLAYEDRATTTSPVNFYMSYGGAEVPEYDVIVRYNVACPFGPVQIILAVLVMAVFLGGMYWLLIKKLPDKEVEFKRVVQVIVNPVIALGAMAVVYIVLIVRLFGPDTKNNLFICAGFIMLLALIVYEVNFGSIKVPRIKIYTFDECFNGLFKVLRVMALAMVIWYCYEYMNGLYDIFHSYSMTKLLVAFCFAVIFSYSRKEVFNIPNAIWLVIGPISGYLFARPHLTESEQGLLYQYYGWLIAVGGFVVINMVMSVIKMFRKKEKPAEISLLFAVPFALFIVGISVFANTRYWVWILCGVCVVLGFRLLFWQGRNLFLKELCLAIIVNFYMMVWFSINHRPYYFYVYYRYNMGYHTVTVTAYYLTLIVCAALIRVYAKWKEKECPLRIIPQLFTLGMSSSFLLLTMSRTGFVSTGAVIMYGLCLVAFVKTSKGSRISTTLKSCAVMLLSVIYMFPVTYSLVDVVPRIANDPITFEYEYRDFTFEKGMPYSDINYMTIEQFAKEFGKKVFNIDPDKKAEGFSNPFVLEVYAKETPVEIESVSTVIDLQDSYDDNEEDVTDMSNGRFDIFISYINEWNLWGHDEMGAQLPNGEIAVHAHNTFLQAIHDHGLVFGIYFAIFMLYVFILGVKGVKDNTDDNYVMLTSVLLAGFASAGMVEWIFHLCNPFGLMVCLSMMPLLIKKKGCKNEESN